MPSYHKDYLQEPWAQERKQYGTRETYHDLRRPKQQQDGRIERRGKRHRKSPIAEYDVEGDKVSLSECFEILAVSFQRHGFRSFQ